MANRIRKCYTEKEFELIIDDFITTGYEIKSKGERNALLIKSCYTFCATAFCLFIIPEIRPFSDFNCKKYSD